MDLISLALNILKGAFEPNTTAFLIMMALSARIWRLSGHAIELIITQSQKSTLVAQFLRLSRRSWSDLFDRFYSTHCRDWVAFASPTAYATD